MNAPVSNKHLGLPPVVREQLDSVDEPTPDYPWDGQVSIPVSEWGKDHWSTLAYVETCSGGVIGNDQMRVTQRRHRKLMGPRQLQFVDGREYPTILSSGRKVGRHDDWDCLNDAISAGYVEVVEEVDTTPDRPFGGMRVTVRMTEEGSRVVAAVRAHKAAGGSFSTFTLGEGIK